MLSRPHPSPLSSQILSYHPDYIYSRRYSAPPRSLDCLISPVFKSLHGLHLRPSPTPTMALNRSLIRNVYFHDATNPDVTLGGFFQNGSITKANFLDMLGILLIVEGNPLRVQERVSGDILSRTDIPLKKGIYDIYCDGMCYISPHLLGSPVANFASLYPSQ